MKKSISSFSVSNTASVKNKSKPISKNNSYHYHKEDKSKMRINPNETSFEKWEKFREAKMELMRAHKQNVEKRMRSDYRHSLTVQPPDVPPPYIPPHSRRRKISLDPNWYTENIYSNQSIDDSDGDMKTTTKLTSSASFSHHKNGSNHHKHNEYNNFRRYDFNGNNNSNGININISNTASGKILEQDVDDDLFDIDCALKSPRFERRNNYPKSSSCSFADYRGPAARDYGPEAAYVPDVRSNSMPKSHSFSTSRNVNPRGLTRYPEMDLIEYQRYKKQLQMNRYRDYRDYRDYYRDYREWTPSEEDSDYCGGLCDRSGCFGEDCLMKHVDKSQNISINNNIINNNNLNATRIINEWDIRNKNCNYRDYNGNRRYPSTYYHHREPIIDDYFEEDDFLLNDSGLLFEDFYRAQRYHYERPNYRRPYYYSMRRNHRELNDLFRNERKKILIRNKFDKLNKYSEDFADDYKKSFEDVFTNEHLNNYPNSHKNKEDVSKDKNSVMKPSVIKNKSMLEVKPPNKYDDTESDSTDLELDDFNFDFEKYWEELEDKQLSTSSTLELEVGTETNNEQNGNVKNQIENNKNNSVKVKNVNVDRYNSGDFVEPQKTDSIPNNKRCKDKSKVHPEEKIQKINNKTNSHSQKENSMNLLNNIFSIYKPSKYSPLNCSTKQHDNFMKILPPKKINISSTQRPLGIVTTPKADHEFTSSMKRPLLLKDIIDSPSSPLSPTYDANATTPMFYPSSDDNVEQAKFQIIPNKTGLKISKLYSFDYSNANGTHINSVNFNSKPKNKLKSTSRPLLFW
jgi:hypothetical protein